MSQWHLMTKRLQAKIYPHNFIQSVFLQCQYKTPLYLQVLLPGVLLLWGDSHTLVFIGFIHVKPNMSKFKKMTKFLHLSFPSLWYFYHLANTGCSVYNSSACLEASTWVSRHLLYLHVCLFHSVISDTAQTTTNIAVLFFWSSLELNPDLHQHHSDLDLWVLRWLGCTLTDPPDKSMTNLRCVCLLSHLQHTDHLMPYLEYSQRSDLTTQHCMLV